MPDEAFWRIRSANFDKLYWAKHKDYLKRIVSLGDLRKSHVVLDVGTGTGTVAQAVAPKVEHVVAMDISDAMLVKGEWSGVSVVKWDIREALFARNTFDRVFARMVFHHVLDGLGIAVAECRCILKPGGKLIVAEGVPPSDASEVTNWFARMFALKEDRQVFMPVDLELMLQDGGFRNVQHYMYYITNFSVVKWLANSGLPVKTRRAILKMHREAPRLVRQAFAMRRTRSDCFIRAKQAIVVGEK